MDILITILANLFLLGYIIVNVFNAIDKGFVRTLLVSVLSLGAFVGLSFLNPIIVKELLKFDIFSAVGGAFNTFIASALFLTLGLIAHSLISLITDLVIRSKRRKQFKMKKVAELGTKRTNVAKKSKSRKDEKREYRKEFKVFRKNIQRKAISKVFASIISVLFALVIGFMVFLPLSKLDLFKNTHTPYSALIPTEIVEVVQNHILGE